MPKKSLVNKKLIESGNVKHIPTSIEVAFLCFIATIQNFQERDFRFMQQMFTLLERGEDFYMLLPIEEREAVKKYIADHGMTLTARIKEIDEELSK